MRGILMKSIRSTLASATKYSVAVLSFCGAFAAVAAGFDGKTLTTNDWFDASFTALTADTPIAQGGTAGITRGAGLWTAVPSSGTAKIVEDADNNSATVLSVEAPEEELEFTPAAFASPTGMETVTFKVKADAIDTLPAPSAAQTAFTLYSADGSNYALMGYVSDGAGGVWTNLVGVTASALVNTWFDLTLDFSGANSSRVVRFAVNGTVLADSEGATWFSAAKSNATTINSLAFSGVGDVKTFNGDSLAEANVASYNDTGYPTVAAAIAAGEADSWANGSVTLLANAEWTPTAAGTYNIALGSYTLSNTGDYTISAGETAGTVTAARIYTWNGSSDTWLSAANWTVGNDTHAAATYPGEVSTEPFTVVFAKNATFASSETVALGDMTVQAAGYTVTLPSVSVPNLATSGNSYYSTAYTRIESGTITCGNYPAHNVRIGEEATLVINQNAGYSGSQKPYFQWFMGNGSIIIDNALLDASGNGNYGVLINKFTGTVTLRNGGRVKSSSNGNTKSITGTGKLVFAGGSEINGGGSVLAYDNSAIEIVAGTSNSSGTTLPFAKTTIVDGGETLDTAEQYVVMTVDAYAGTVPAVSSDLTAAGWDVIRSTNGVGKTILVLTHSQTYVWTGAADDGLWATPENWKVGAYVPATAPGAGDTVSITTEEESLAIVVTDGQNVGTLTKDENVALVGPGPYTVAVSDAGEVTLTRVPSTFVWTNAAENDNTWANLGNWTVNGRATDVLPGSSDTAQFNSSCAVQLGQTGNVSNIVLNADVTFSSGANILNVNAFSGTGKLLANGLKLVSYDGFNLDIGDVEICEASENTFRAYHRTYKYVNFNGKVTGSGLLQVDQNNTMNASGAHFNGDATEFEGEFKIINCKSNVDQTVFASGNATSSNAVWTVYGYAKTDMFKISNETYWFGALNGNVNIDTSDYRNEIWLEVGARSDVNSSFGGRLSRGDKDNGHRYQNHLRKVGAGVLETTCTYIGDIELMNGTLVLKSSDSLPKSYTWRSLSLKFLGGTLRCAKDANDVEVDPSATIKSSTGAINVEVLAGESYTWATALASSNNGGLVKKGDGILVLGAAPLYSGDTYLDGGTLKIPAAAGVSVKTHVAGKSVKRSSETIDAVEYTVYTLGDKKPLIFMVY